MIDDVSRELLRCQLNRTYSDKIEYKLEENVITGLVHHSQHELQAWAMGGSCNHISGL